MTVPESFELRRLREARAEYVEARRAYFDALDPGADASDAVRNAYWAANERARDRYHSACVGVVVAAEHLLARIDG